MTEWFLGFISGMLVGTGLCLSIAALIMIALKLDDRFKRRKFMEEPWPWPGRETHSDLDEQHPRYTLGPGGGQPWPNTSKKQRSET